MKKAFTLILSLVLVGAMLTGCGKKEEKAATPTTAPTATTAPTEVTATTAPTDTEASAAKTGLAVSTSIAKSTDAGEEDGLAQVDSTIVAVLVDQDGKIIDCKIDAAQTKMNFSAEGALVTDIATEFKSKQELGTEYGMIVASGIGKEWNEQANALAEYVIGKTIEEVKGIALNEEGVTTDTDLAASVTIKLPGYISTIEKAVANAQDLGAVTTDKLGLAVSTEMSKSTAATADEEGLAQAYSTYSVVTTDADGKITSTYLDASQGNVNFSTAGVISTDVASTPLTKQELKEDYGMKKASAIGKEWYEQANAFTTYVTGKTAAEVGGIALTADGLASEADLAASVTVHVGPFMAIVQKAVANAAE